MSIDDRTLSRNAARHQCRDAQPSTDGGAEVEVGRPGLHRRCHRPAEWQRDHLHTTGPPDEIADAIRRLLSDEFDVNVPCVVRTASQVRRVLDCDPLRDVVVDPSRCLVNFLSEEPDPKAVGALVREDHRPEAIAIRGAEAYIWTPDGVKAMTLSYAYLESGSVWSPRHGTGTR